MTAVPMYSPAAEPDDGGPSDAELVALVRGHETDAFRLLYERHRPAVLRCARQYAPTTFDAEDLTEEAFARVLTQLNAGAGPQTSVRAYLCTVVRHLAADRGRRSSREETVDDLPEPAVTRDDMATSVERGYVQRAFGSLPPRWRQVLWYGEVEGRRPAEIANLLGMSPRSVSALAYRAREGFRQAYLQAHLDPRTPEGCRRTVERLPAYVRSALPLQSEDQVRDHLAQCAFCHTRYVELTEVDRDLRGILAPVLLGAPLATPGVFGRLIDRLRDTVGNHFTAVAAGGIATAVVGAAALVALPDTNKAAYAAKPPAPAAPANRAPAKAPAGAKPPVTTPKRPATGPPARKSPPATTRQPTRAVPPATAQPAGRRPTRTSPPAIAQPARAHRPATTQPAARRLGSKRPRATTRHSAAVRPRAKKRRPAITRQPVRPQRPATTVKPPIKRPSGTRPPTVRPPTIKRPHVHKRPHKLNRPPAIAKPPVKQRHQYRRHWLVRKADRIVKRVMERRPARQRGHR